MRSAYFDCYSGIAGDMIVGAFLDLGLPFAYLKKELKKLGLTGYKLTAVHGKKHGIGGTKFNVIIGSEHQLDHYSDIVRMIGKSKLNENVKRLSLAIFKTLAEAEGKVHRKRPADIHFHEVGAIDSVVDIVGSAIAVDYFKFEKIYSSPLPITRGFVRCAHGRFPVPAPATLEIMRGIEIVPQSVQGEIVTPTGASIIKNIAEKFCSMPLRKIDKIGYGLGDKDFKEIPNALRIITGEGHPLIVIETNIDDMSPELYPYVMEKILSAGAVDVCLVPVVMKKGRPGVLLQVICEEEERKKITSVILKETTTFGVRYFPVEREMAEREFRTVKTRYGAVRVKIARYNGWTTTISPEFKDCEALARKRNVPLKEVYRQAIILCR